jgi:hypothetical protein
MKKNKHTIRLILLHRFLAILLVPSFVLVPLAPAMAQDTSTLPASNQPAPQNNTVVTASPQAQIPFSANPDSSSVPAPEVTTPPATDKVVTPDKTVVPPDVTKLAALTSETELGQSWSSPPGDTHWTPQAGDTTGGRLPNLGTKAFYTGAHTARQGAEELVSGSMQTLGQTALRTAQSFSKAVSSQLQSAVTSLQGVLQSFPASRDKNK